MTLVVAAIGACLGLGAVVFVGAWAGEPPRRRDPAAQLDTLLRPLAAATVAGAAMLAFTGWVVAGVFTTLAVAVFAGGARRGIRSPKIEQQRIEALAGWREQLRDGSADHGSWAVRVSVRTCPDAMGPEVGGGSAAERPRPAAAAVRDDPDVPRLTWWRRC